MLSETILALAGSAETYVGMYIHYHETCFDYLFFIYTEKLAEHTGSFTMMPCLQLKSQGTGF